MPVESRQLSHFLNGFLYKAFRHSPFFQGGYQPGFMPCHILGFIPTQPFADVSLQQRLISLQPPVGRNFLQRFHHIDGDAQQFFNIISTMEESDISINQN